MHCGAGIQSTCHHTYRTHSLLHHVTYYTTYTTQSLIAHLVHAIALWCWHTEYMSSYIWNTFSLTSSLSAHLVHAIVNTITATQFSGKLPTISILHHTEHILSSLSYKALFESLHHLPTTRMSTEYAHNIQNTFCTHTPYRTHFIFSPS